MCYLNHRAGFSTECNVIALMYVNRITLLKNAVPVTTHSWRALWAIAVIIGEGLLIQVCVCLCVWVWVCVCIYSHTFSSILTYTPCHPFSLTHPVIIHPPSSHILQSIFSFPSIPFCCCGCCDAWFNAIQSSSSLSSSPSSSHRSAKILGAHSCAYELFCEYLTLHVKRIITFVGTQIVGSFRVQYDDGTRNVWALLPRIAGVVLHGM